MKKIFRRIMTAFFIMMLPLSACASEVTTITDLSVAPAVIIRTKDAAAYPSLHLDESAEQLEVVFPKVRDADAAIIRCGNEVVLIDCASAGQAKAVVKALQTMGVTRIKSVVSTHPHYDHLEGLAIVADAVQVDELRICFHEKYNDRMEEAVAVCAARNISVVHYADGDVLTIGGATLTSYLKGDANWDLNGQSAVQMLRFGERAMLFTADATNRAQKRLVEKVGADALKADILKYPHHGLNAMAEPFKAAVSPELAIITNMSPRTGDAVYQMRLARISYLYTTTGAIRARTDGAIWIVDYLTEK